MPRENRKRGKKHKSKPSQPVPSEPGPSWIVAVSDLNEDFNPEAPFGYVDADLKAYFRNVDLHIRDWQEGREQVETEAGVDPNTEKHMFFLAALTEMRGKEKQLATDPDCSLVLERIAYSMDDFVRRVFLDSLSGSYETLVKHRFASHVCQTLFTVVSDTIVREHHVFCSSPDPHLPSIVVPTPDSSQGELRTATELILDICKELLPSISTLLTDPFASHVIRALLGLLCPSSLHDSADESTPGPGAVRSKRSARWKSQQGPLVSVFQHKDKKDINKDSPARGEIIEMVPEFREMSREIVRSIRNELGDNEVRALAVDQVACPCLLMLLNVEAELNMADEHGSLMDRITVGAVSASLQAQTPSLTPSDYLATLFRDPTSSHLLETVLSQASQKPFGLIWNTYLKGKLSRLSVHPIGNFVVARAVERVDKAQLDGVYEDLGHGGVWEKMISARSQFDV
ncbi:armadillo-type protein, partial [Lentinula raphanica]